MHQKFEATPHQILSTNLLLLPLAMDGRSPTHEKTTSNSISVLGLGVMGSAIARAFVQNGWETTVWNRSTVKAQPLAAIGATVTTSAPECVAASPVVIFCLLGSDAFQDVLQTIDPRLCNNRHLVDFSSGSPSQIRESQTLATKLTFSDYLRGAIITTPAYIGLPKSVLYYSGSRGAFQSIEPALKVLGRAIYLGDDIASATLRECIAGNCFFGFAAGFIQSMALLKSSKSYVPGDAERLMSEVLSPWLANDVPKMFGDLAKQIDKGDYQSRGEGAPLVLLTKSLKGLLRTHAEQGLSSIIINSMLELFQSRVALGGANEEMSSLVEALYVPAALLEWRN